ncbi:hypothetical protein RRF57_009723 [Xylaria bambusicola]|uniref:Uncharacterized protein n=1 Tax=Xylaria bambusicola TaxID=326684 RepID=A0AAN7V2X5_9PEZI
MTRLRVTGFTKWLTQGLSQEVARSSFAVSHSARLVAVIGRAETAEEGRKGPSESNLEADCQAT